MADTTIPMQLANAIPVVVGAILAIAGGIASQYVVHLLAESREKMKMRRERIESLVKALYAYEQWVEDKQNTMIFRNEDHEGPSPLNEVRLLQALHFPELAKEVHAVQEAYIPMLKFIHDQRIARMTDEKGFIANWNAAPFDQAYKQHLQAARALTERCRYLLQK